MLFEVVIRHLCLNNADHKHGIVIKPAYDEVSVWLCDISLLLNLETFHSPRNVVVVVVVF